MVGAYAAMTANVLFFLDTGTNTAWRGVFQTVFWTTPVFFVLQISALIFLSWQIVYRKGLVTRGLLRHDYRLRSGSHFVVLLTLIAVCVWYVFATAVLDMATDPLMDLRLAAVVPGVAAANYALLAIEIKRQGQLQAVGKPAILTWFAALAVTLIIKIPLAMRLFAALPVERPNGYGDCFVVSAAAQQRSVANLACI